MAIENYYLETKAIDVILSNGKIHKAYCAVTNEEHPLRKRLVKTYCFFSASKGGAIISNTDYAKGLKIFTEATELCHFVKCLIDYAKKNGISLGKPKDLHQ